MRSTGVLSPVADREPDAVVDVGRIEVFAGVFWGLLVMGGEYSAGR
ncbi:MAG: hypothetical protein V7721_12195 [Porticoccaceae bacterium]